MMIFNPLFLQVINGQEQAQIAKSGKQSNPANIFSEIIKISTAKNETAENLLSVEVQSAQDLNIINPQLVQLQQLNQLMPAVEINKNSSKEINISELISSILNNVEGSNKLKAEEKVDKIDPDQSLFLNKDQVIELISSLINNPEFQNKLNIISSENLNGGKLNESLEQLSKATPQEILSLLEKGNVISLENSTEKNSKGMLISLIEHSDKEGSSSILQMEENSLTGKTEGAKQSFELKLIPLNDEKSAQQMLKTDFDGNGKISENMEEINSFLKTIVKQNSKESVETKNTAEIKSTEFSKLNNATELNKEVNQNPIEKTLQENQPSNKIKNAVFSEEKVDQSVKIPTEANKISGEMKVEVEKTNLVKAAEKQIENINSASVKQSEKLNLASDKQIKSENKVQDELKVAELPNKEIQNSDKVSTDKNKAEVSVKETPQISNASKQSSSDENNLKNAEKNNSGEIKIDQQIKSEKNEFKDELNFSADKTQPEISSVKKETENKEPKNNSTNTESKIENEKQSINQVSNKIEHEINIKERIAEPRNNFNQIMKTVKAAEIMKEVSQFIQQKDAGSLVLKISPENLGTIKIALDVVDEIVNAKIEVNNSAAREVLESNVKQLQNSLAQNGVQVNSINISLSNFDQKQNRNFVPNKRKSYGYSDEKEIEEGTKTNDRKLGYNTIEYLA